ncbi:hypothetical protein [Bradyrhizobium sp. CCGUVB23]|uniref:hypothetical protein n=1 Tax=Bradyrhizobium sp. CCGUVB23 TaxID=2949630 RepID=UPI0020B266C1|nr:hypothetical protein [Bradyrhizobium sp. CCGUVB23]MCP3464841.1 hypothetical protein [Bradyrhizobium sp. CCGUVB23]
MDSVSNPTQVEPHFALSARMDQELTHTYEKIKSVDEEIARASEKLSRLEREEREERREERDDTRSRLPRGRPVVRGLVGLVLAAGIGTAALVSQSSRGDEVRQMIAGWAPLHAAMPSQAQPLPDAQPSPTVQLAQASPQPEPAAQTVPEAVAPTAATLPPQVTELLEKMASDLANVQQGIEQLKASQEQLKANQQQMSLDNLRVADELKAGQEQMARLVAKAPDNNAPVNAPDKTTGKTVQAPDPNARPKTATAAVPPPRPAAASAHKPAQAAPAPHAAVRRSAPVQLESAQQ